MGIGSLWAANDLLAWAWLALLTLATLFALDRAVVSAGRVRFACIGFLAPVVCYGAVISIAEKSRRSLEQGDFVTSKALALFYRPIRGRAFQNAQTGDWLDELPEGAKVLRAGAEEWDLWGRAFVAGPPQTKIVIHHSPKPSAFMTVGHCLWALLFGYAGMKWSASIYRRRQRRIESERTEPAPSP
ncbi:MAG: hypothetical protein AAGJ46_19190 [Planctomycetota bacterium]